LLTINDFYDNINVKTRPLLNSCGSGPITATAS